MLKTILKTVNSSSIKKPKKRCDPNGYYVYKGRKGVGVTVNGKYLNPAFGVINHSQGRLEWGIDSAGSSQLALAIMVNQYGEDLSLHPVNYQVLKNELLAGLNPLQFEFDSLMVDTMCQMCAI